MNKLLICLVLTAITVCIAEQYTDRYDDLNVNEIIENKRLLTAYVKCVLDQGRCTPEGKEVKKYVVDAMQTVCKKCTKKQRDGARKILNHIRAKETEYWKQLTNKYDPTNEYREGYEGFLNADD